MKNVCLNCGSNNVGITSRNDPCRTSSCRNKIVVCVECRCTKSSYCPDCQENLVRDMKLATRHELEVIEDVVKLENILNQVKSKLERWIKLLKK